MAQIYKANPSPLNRGSTLATAVSELEFETGPTSGRLDWDGADLQDPAVPGLPNHLSDQPTFSEKKSREERSLQGQLHASNRLDLRAALAGRLFLQRSFRPRVRERVKRPHGNLGFTRLQRTAEEQSQAPS
mmetsp:Transcript_98259/g.204942  ORF Transcript_98259/g.204942 Transcript_98259/m.204942 type:complete len:131 (-) Transcript_98259:744-1136(-)